MSEEKQLSLGDLIAGDVLVMQGPQNVLWASIIAAGDMDAALIQAIMYLSDSDVCHGAIYWGQQQKVYSLIDDGEKGVGQHGMAPSPGKVDHWYVRRMQGGKDLQPVLDVAKKYTGVATAYDWELLSMLGLLLVYKKVVPNTALFQTLLTVLEKLVVALDQCTHSAKTDYFVCSQFVAACFDQAGSEYQLDITNGNLWPDAADNVVSLLDWAVQHQGNVITGGAPSAPALSIADLQSLVEAKGQAPADAMHGTSDPGNTATVCDQFLALFFSLNAGALGLSDGQYDTADKRQALAQKYQADFVTPADLKSNCNNLSAVGMIQFVYGKTM